MIVTVIEADWMIVIDSMIVIVIEADWMIVIETG